MNNPTTFPPSPFPSPPRPQPAPQSSETLIQRLGFRGVLFLFPRDSNVLSAGGRDGGGEEGVTDERFACVMTSSWLRDCGQFPMITNLRKSHPIQLGLREETYRNQKLDRELGDYFFPLSFFLSFFISFAVARSSCNRRSSAVSFEVLICVFCRAVCEKVEMRIILSQHWCCLDRDTQLCFLGGAFRSRSWRRKKRDRVFCGNGERNVADSGNGAAFAEESSDSRGYDQWTFP